ncbi:MAG: DUF1868 domain-containing protein [Anaerolineaceae bacterium]|nr:DUF1868 domain-containing protein [Anaerolineaceae bacterium]
MTGRSFSKHVGIKFMADGSARHFAGNTVICFIRPQSETWLMLSHIHRLLCAQDWARQFSLLPPSSYHMTVFEGVCDQVRGTDDWTRALPLEAPLTAVDEFFAGQWQAVPAPDGFRVRFDRIEVNGFITIRLAPADAAAEAEIRSFRDLLSERFQLRQPNHDAYGFHISLAYNIVPLDEAALRAAREWTVSELVPMLERLGQIDLLPPGLVFFEDMTHFAGSRAAARRNVTDSPGE